MKKIGFVVAAFLLICAALGACSNTETEALPTTIKSADSRISVSVPEGWSEYSGEIKDNSADLVLALSGSGGAYAQVFWYPDVEGKELTAADYVLEAENYYGDYVTGSAAEVTVDGNAGYYFAYKIEVTDEAAAASGAPAATDEDNAAVSETPAVTGEETAAASATPAATDAEPSVTDTYQGYEYFIAFPGGVVEVDIFFHFTDTAPTNDDLAVLRDIAQTVRVK